VEGREMLRMDGWRETYLRSSLLTTPLGYRATYNRFLFETIVN
jgi:hypothetical protein